MRLLFFFITLGIRLGIGVAGFPIRLLRGIASKIRRRLTWLGPLARIGLNFLAVVRRNSIVSTAITLSVINFGLLMWQIWPEDTAQTITSISQPTGNSETLEFLSTAGRNSETLEFDNTSARITELEKQVRDLSREQLFQFDRLRDCINFPSPFGCQQ